MVVSYIDFVLFFELLCLRCIWLLGRIQKEKKNMIIESKGNTIFRNVQTFFFV